VPDNPTREALEELLDYLEQVETRTGAILLFLKDKGILASDEELKPYLNQASFATDVISRAIHARFDALFNRDEALPATEAVLAESASNDQVTPAATAQPEGSEQQKPEASEQQKDAA